MSTTAVVVFSDPSGGDEALGRLFNALFLTHELKTADRSVALIFQGAGARWPGVVSTPGHPAGDLFRSVQDKASVCGGCADVFGATETATASGLSLVRERDIPGVGGVLDLSRYVLDGNQLVTF
jgi:hypothetical protein